VSEVYSRTKRKNTSYTPFSKKKGCIIQLLRWLISGRDGAQPDSRQSSRSAALPTTATGTSMDPVAFQSRKRVPLPVVSYPCCS